RAEDRIRGGDPRPDAGRARPVRGGGRDRPGLDGDRLCGGCGEGSRGDPAAAGGDGVNAVTPRADHAPLSDEAVAAYARTGWCAVPGFYSPAETAQLTAWTEEVTALPEVPGTHAVYHEKSLIDGDPSLVQRIEDFCAFHAGFDREMRT